MEAVLALRQLRGLPPSVARQLFSSTVASKIDYAAFVWWPIRQVSIVAAGVGRPFEAIQRVAFQAVVGAFQNTALVIAEAEAGIEPTVVHGKPTSRLSERSSRLQWRRDGWLLKSEEAEELNRRPHMW